MTTPPPTHFAVPAHFSGDSLGRMWHQAFFNVVEPAEIADPLRAAAIAGRLGEWTQYLTGAVVASCQAMGLRAAAKGNSLDLLAEARQEYLGLDVTAFLPASTSSPSWPYPVAVFELENSPRDDRVAYSLWKVSTVRAALGVVFAYRKSWDAAFDLVGSLARAVPEGFGPGWVQGSESEIVLALGSRSDNEAFPWGYFKFWSFNRNIRQFEKL